MNRMDDGEKDHRLTGFGRLKVTHRAGYVKYLLLLGVTFAYWIAYPRIQRWMGDGSTALSLLPTLLAGWLLLGSWC